VKPPYRSDRSSRYNGFGSNPRSGNIPARVTTRVTTMVQTRAMRKASFLKGVEYLPDLCKELVFNYVMGSNSRAGYRFFDIAKARIKPVMVWKVEAVQQIEDWWETDEVISLWEIMTITNPVLFTTIFLAPVIGFPDYDWLEDDQ
jgi:hypothetical protein